MTALNYIYKHLSEIDNAFLSISNDTLIQITEAILNNNLKNNKLFFTGIGKNGHVASKAASTFNSIGIPVIYINPVDAVHGDIGLIHNNDMIIAISKSGNTDELILFLNKANQRTDNIWLIHSNKNNNSIKYCYNDIFIEVKNEADHLNIIPTVSISVYTILLQSIACAIADGKNLTLQQFVKNHPGGSLGKLK